MAEIKSDKDQVQRKLYRSQSERVIGGVASGLAKYFNVDTIVVRVVFILAAVLGGLGVPLYIIAWIIVPKDYSVEESSKEKSNQATFIWGAMFVILGFIILGRQFYWWDYDNFYYDWHWHPWSFLGFDFEFILPVALILAGIFYIMKTRKEKSDGVETSKQKSGENKMEKKLTRSVNDKMVGGVCGGLSKYLNLDVSVVRIGFALLTIGSGFFTGVIVYAAMIFIVPEEDEETAKVKPADVKASGSSGSEKTTTVKSTTVKSASNKPKSKAKPKTKPASKAKKPKDSGESKQTS